MISDDSLEKLTELVLLVYPNRDFDANEIHEIAEKFDEAITHTLESRFQNIKASDSQ